MKNTFLEDLYNNRNFTDTTLTRYSVSMAKEYPGSFDTSPRSDEGEVREKRSILKRFLDKLIRERSPKREEGEDVFTGYRPTLGIFKGMAPLPDKSTPVDRSTATELTKSKYPELVEPTKEATSLEMIASSFPKKLDAFTRFELARLAKQYIASADTMRTLSSFLGVSYQDIESHSYTQEALNLLDYAEENALTDRFFLALNLYVEGIDVSRFTEEAIEERRKELEKTVGLYPSTLDGATLEKLISRLKYRVSGAVKMEAIALSLGISYEAIESSSYEEEVIKLITFAQEHSSIDTLLFAVQFVQEGMDLSFFTTEHVEERQRQITEASEKIAIDDRFPTTLLDVYIYDLKRVLLYEVDEEELQVVAHFMGVEYALLKGSIEDKTNQLVEYAQEHSKQQQLLSAVHDLLPDLDVSQFTTERMEERQALLETSLGIFPSTLHKGLIEDLKKVGTFSVDSRKLKAIANFVGIEYSSLEGSYTENQFSSLVDAAQDAFLMNRLLAALKDMESDLDLVEFTKERIDEKQRQITEASEKITIDDHFPKTVVDEYEYDLKRALAYEIETEEIQVIAYRMGVDYYSLRGDIEDKTNALIDQAQEHETLHIFLSAVKHLKRDIDVSKFTKERMEERQRLLETSIALFPKTLNREELSRLEHVIRHEVDDRKMQIVADFVGIKYDSLSGYYGEEKVENLVNHANSNAVINRLLSVLQYVQDGVDLSYFTTAQIEERQQVIIETAKEIKIDHNFPSKLERVDFLHLKNSYPEITSDELKIIAHFLDIDYDNIEGGLMEKIEHILDISQKNGNMHLFLSAVQHLNKGVDVSKFTKEHTKKRQETIEQYAAEFPTTLDDYHTEKLVKTLWDSIGNYTDLNEVCGYFNIRYEDIESTSYGDEVRKVIEYA